MSQPTNKTGKSQKVRTLIINLYVCVFKKNKRIVLRQIVNVLWLFACPEPLAISSVWMRGIGPKGIRYNICQRVPQLWCVHWPRGVAICPSQHAIRCESVTANTVLRNVQCDRIVVRRNIQIEYRVGNRVDSPWATKFKTTKNCIYLKIK